MKPLGHMVSEMSSTGIVFGGREEDEKKRIWGGIIRRNCSNIMIFLLDSHLDLKRSLQEERKGFDCLFFTSLVIPIPHKS